MAEWLDNIHESQRTLFDESYHITEIADALATVGLYRLAGKLYASAITIRKAETAIGRSIGQMLSDDLKRADKVTHDMIIGVIGLVTSDDYLPDGKVKL